jgi:thioredoxin-related protein
MSIFYRTALFLLFSLSFGTFLSGQNIIRWISWIDLPAKMDKSDRKFVVYLYYDGCKWCKFMEQSTLSDDHIARFVNNNFYALRLNALSTEKISIADKNYKNVTVGKYDFNELAVELTGGEMKFPNIVFLNEKFEKIQAIPEYIPVTEFEVILSYFAGNHHKNTLFKRFTKNYCKESHFNTLVNGKH